MKISALPLEALLYKLSQSGTGFNDSLRSVAESEYNVKPFTIQWPGSLYESGTNSFVLGKVDPEDIDTFGTTGITKVTMFVDKADNQNFEKPRDFSGMVQIGLDFHLGYLSSDMRQNFEAMMLAVEDAVAQVIQPFSQQNWGAGVVYNGAFSAIRGMVYVPKQGQGAVRQLLAIRLAFFVSVGC